MLSEIFWTFLITSTIGCFLGVVRILYKSKCKEASICCIKFIRDTEGEENIDTQIINKTNYQNINNSNKIENI